MINVKFGDVAVSVENNTRVVNEWLQKVLDGYNAYFGTNITAQDIKNA